MWSTEYFTGIFFGNIYGHWIFHLNIPVFVAHLEYLYCIFCLEYSYGIFIDLEYFLWIFAGSSWSKWGVIDIYKYINGWEYFWWIFGFPYILYRAPKHNMPCRQHRLDPLTVCRRRSSSPVWEHCRHADAGEAITIGPYLLHHEKITSGQHYTLKPVWWTSDASKECFIYFVVCLQCCPTILPRLIGCRKRGRMGKRRSGYPCAGLVLDSCRSFSSLSSSPLAWPELKLVIDDSKTATYETLLHNFEMYWSLWEVLHLSQVKF